MNSTKVMWKYMSNCNDIRRCLLWFRSDVNLIPNLSIFGYIRKSTGIQILNGENDTQTTVQHIFLLQQRLTDVNHPVRLVITYPYFGHKYYSSSQWSTTIGQYQNISWQISIHDVNLLMGLYLWLFLAHLSIHHTLLR